MFIAIMPSWRRFQFTPLHLRPWLYDTGSLTKRLQNLSHTPIEVSVLRQTVGQARADEARLLGCAERTATVIREVILWGNGEPWVFARSLLPLSSLQGPLKRLRKLDNTPLGHLLFTYPSVKRDPIEVACVRPPRPASSASFQSLSSQSKSIRYVPARWQGEQVLWGRRSRFMIHQKPLLVSEVFLPHFEQLLLPPTPFCHPADSTQ